eukprot:gene17710-24069_t
MQLFSQLPSELVDSYSVLLGGRNLVKQLEDATINKVHNPSGVAVAVLAASLGASPLRVTRMVAGGWSTTSLCRGASITA